MKKTLAMILAVVLLMTACVAGTLAWLQDTTAEVKNTFTVGKVDIELVETANQEDGSWSAQLVPGTEYAKDPKVSVVAGSEACYLFVKIVETNDPATYLDYSYNLDGWTALGSDDGIYYRTISEADAAAGVSYYLLTGTEDNANGAVTVKDTVGSTTVPMPAEGATPTISFQAYAIQSDNMTDAANAWAKLNAQA